MQRIAACFVIALSMLLARAVRAEPLARLEVERAPDAASCPARAELLDAVIARRSADVIGPEARRLVRVRFEHSGSGYRAIVTLLDGTGADLGSRTLEATGDCAGMARAVSFVVSLALDGEGLEPAPVKAPEPPPPPPPEPPPVSVVVSSGKITPSRPVSVHAEPGLPRDALWMAPL